MALSRPIVIDASVVLALILDEPEGADVERAMRSWVATRRPLIVPSQFWLEVFNRLIRLPGASGRSVLAALHRLDTFGLVTEQPDRPWLLRVLDLTERHRLTAYDAGYLALAERMDAELASLDRDLIAAAGERAVVFGRDHRIHEEPAWYEREVTWPAYKGVSAYLASLRAEALAGRD